MEDSNNKMVMTASAYGKTTIIEADADLNIYDVVDEVVVPLLRAMGYAEESIDKAITGGLND